MAPFFQKAQITICFSSKYTLQTTMTSYLIQCTKCFTLYDPAVLIAQNINTKLNKCPLCQASIKRIPKETTRQTKKLTKGTNYRVFVILGTEINFWIASGFDFRTCLLPLFNSQAVKCTYIY
jgi:glutamine synthetase type III